MFGCDQVITLHFYSTQSMTGLPEKLVLVDIHQPCCRQKSLDKADKHFIQIAVRGNMGSIAGIVDGRLNFAVESVEEVDTLVELFRPMLRTDSESGRPMQRSRSSGMLCSAAQSMAGNAVRNARRSMPLLK
mmetsp:Transcript_10813/g.30342  ORF Transcript_10813/g.30342 Transcript_10813/m.30342 type:complete len:131 (-) Transcript_10813:80-472(-)